jgi:Uma2 family endonuclease
MLKGLAAAHILLDAELRRIIREAYDMGMPDTVGRWTREMVLALPDDGNRYELFDGELLVTPAPAGPHQTAVSFLTEVLLPYIAAEGLGRLFTSPADLSLGGEQLSQPDLFVMPSLPPSRAWADFPDPILVIEILSPATARSDRLVKRRRFQRAGIPEYWIVDLDARIVERWRPSDERPEILDGSLEWSPTGADAALRIDLPQLFRDIWGR